MGSGSALEAYSRQCTVQIHSLLKAACIHWLIHLTHNACVMYFVICLWLSISLLCLCQARLAGDIVYPTHPFVHLLWNLWTQFWKFEEPILMHWHKWSMRQVHEKVKGHFGRSGGHRNSPESCRRLRPTPEIRNFVFFILTLKPLLSMPAFQTRRLEMHSSRESAITTRSPHKKYLAANPNRTKKYESDESHGEIKL